MNLLQTLWHFQRKKIKPKYNLINTLFYLLSSSISVTICFDNFTGFCIAYIGLI